MDKTLSQVQEKNFVSPFPHPYTTPPPTMNNVQSNVFNLNNMVSPSVLLIIIILAIIFFISGLLHLLVRFLLRPPARDPDELDSVTALQGQLQQLFHLHDSGVDQSFIDTLPVFTYKAIIGVKDPFDCAVCLCEFEAEDKLRLLPKCSHAFHMECIDTWLLSHSTCPLCRACLLQDFSQTNNCSPIVFVLESGSTEISREIGSERECNNSAVARVNSHISNDDFRVPLQDLLKKSCEFQVKEVENQSINMEKVVQVKLGKFKNVDLLGEGSSNNSSIDSRRCFSMGAFAYVMDDNTSLKVPIIAPVKKNSSKKNSLHRAALSECGWDSRREFNGLDASKILEHKDANKGFEEAKRKSFSASKNWLREGKERPNTEKIVSSRRSFSEVGFDRFENDEVQSSNSFASQPNAPSFTRRTLQWLMGKPNKVEQSNFSSNV
ncbi:ubiquitin-protein ligase [Lithospermum erythrorhizon]|uniref:RING-type E3 ubiquitin transferase n=1 Tax=Lithospermum erythrorhizon TaxID=34254 RepID=A0AAV3R204_LITER